MRLYITSYIPTHKILNPSMPVVTISTARFHIKSTTLYTGFFMHFVRFEQESKIISVHKIYRLAFTTEVERIYY
jgi:hypothetical protein